MSSIVIVMGVSGSGKSSIGEALALALAVPFYDADDYHPPENVEKMANGSPLNDADRRPWLARLHRLIADHHTQKTGMVLACSALKKAYRDQLRGDLGDEVTFVYLHGNFNLIWERMAARQAHFMKAEMLQSQFDTLEPPSTSEALRLHIDADIPELTRKILQHLQD